MAEIIANTFPAFAPSHPGDLLAEIIPATGKRVTEIANLLGISRQHLHSIIAGRKAVSPETAKSIAAHYAIDFYI